MNEQLHSLVKITRTALYNINEKSISELQQQDSITDITKQGSQAPNLILCHHQCKKAELNTAAACIGSTLSSFGSPQADRHTGLVHTHTHPL